MSSRTLPPELRRAAYASTSHAYTIPVPQNRVVWAPLRLATLSALSFLVSYSTLVNPHFVRAPESPLALRFAFDVPAHTAPKKGLPMHVASSTAEHKTAAPA